MSESITIPTVAAPIHATVRPPGSKSITNRALVCAALARGSSTLRGALDSEDTRVMVEALGQLGVRIEASDERATLTVAGCEGEIPVSKADLAVGNSGTTVRFLTAIVALGSGRFRLDGVARMRQRPIQDLLSALGPLGVDAQSELGTGCPPVVVNASGIQGGRTELGGNISSQFLSGLLMACPYACNSVTVAVRGELVSRPYVTMTLAVMKAFGVQVESGDLSEFRLPGNQCYTAREYPIEPDASAASYFFAAAAITGGEVTVAGLTRESLQGDVAFCECLAQMGCRVRYENDSITVSGAGLRGIDVNMNAISDTVQTLAAVALFASGTTRIRGVAHIRHKETDRIGDLARELRKLGAQVDERDDGLAVTPGPLTPAVIDTYQDHRMAMSLALVGLRQPGVVINDPGCTAKTYPNYFDDLGALVKQH